MRIGLVYAVFAKAAYTEGSAITYTGGKKIGAAIKADYTENRRDNEAYGDDVVIETDKGITDYSIAFSVDDIPLTDRKDLLGWTEVTGGTPSAVTGYEINDTEPPLVGFGWIRKLRKGGVDYYEAQWCRAVQFTMDTVSDNTKQKEITFAETALTGKGRGVYTDATGVIRFVEHSNRETTLAGAKTWLNGKAGIQ